MLLVRPPTTAGTVAPTASAATITVVARIPLRIVRLLCRPGWRRHGRLGAMRRGTRRRAPPVSPRACGRSLLPDPGALAVGPRHRCAVGDVERRRERRE